MSILAATKTAFICVGPTRGPVPVRPSTACRSSNKEALTASSNGSPANPSRRSAMILPALFLASQQMWAAQAQAADTPALGARPARRRGLDQYIQRKQLDPLETYLPIVIQVSQDVTAQALLRTLIVIRLLCLLLTMIGICLLDMPLHMHECQDGGEPQLLPGVGRPCDAQVLAGVSPSGVRMNDNEHVPGCKKKNFLFGCSEKVQPVSQTSNQASGDGHATHAA